MDVLKKIWQAKQLRNNIFYVLALLVIFRVVAHIPLPGVDAMQLRIFFQQNQALGLLNIFSGGTIETFSVVALGVGPYITASIFFQLLTMIFPKLEEMQKESEAGRQKLNQWTRMLTVPLAALQGYALIALFNQGGGVVGGGTAPFAASGLGLAVTLVTMIAGTLFTMWLGELITEKKLGNGVSLMIFAGIISGLPTFVQRTLLTYDSSQLLSWILYGAAALMMLVVIVIMNEAQRLIPISYARQNRGMQVLPGVSNTLPLRVNMSGVVPIIFAISMMTFPVIVARFFIQAKTQWLAEAARFVVRLFENQFFYNSLYFLLIFGFTYFYAAIVFQPDKISENLQKQGAFVPGIRPGKATADYLQAVANKILLAGGLFLAAVALVPNVLQQYTASVAVAIGGTSFIIVVSVVIETVKQIETRLAAEDYDEYAKLG